MTSAVQVREIERELSRLWHDGATDSSGQPLVRACTLTLIVVAECDHATAELHETLRDVTRRHPARTILVLVERGNGGDGVRRDPSASIRAMCNLADSGDRQICHEQIELSVPERRLTEIESWITPLFVP